MNANNDAKRKSWILNVPAKPWLLAALVLGLVLGAMIAPIGAASPGGPGVADTLPHERRYYQADPRGLINSIENTGRARLLVGDHGMLDLELRPSDLFSTKSPMIEHEDGNGNVIGKTPITARPYNGHVVGDESARAAITIDTPGVYGLVVLDGIEYNYAPVEQPRNGRVRTQVEWVPIPAGKDPPIARAPGIAHEHERGVQALQETRVVEAPFQKVRQNVAPEGARQNQNDVCWGPYQTDVATDVKAYASATYVTTRSDYSTLITNALNAQEWLWGCYTSVNINLYGITTPGTDYDTSNVCDDLLIAFRINAPSESGIEAKQLFVGRDIHLSCNGKGYGDTAGEVEEFAYLHSIILAVEYDSGDSYNPYSSNHLGKLSAQEIAHNWGEPGHPTDTHNSKLNVMMGGGTNNWNLIDFWFATSSQSNVYNAWH